MSTLKNINKLYKNRLLTALETSKIIGVSSKQLIRYCNSHKIPYFYIGKQYRFNIEDVLKFKIDRKVSKE